MNDQPLTTAEAAKQLRVTPRRVRALIERGQLPATRHGRDWIIYPRDLAQLNRRPYHKTHNP